MNYRLVYSETVRVQLLHLHPSLKAVIRQRLRLLSDHPYTGKPLERELSGYCSLRARRFRILYKVNERESQVEIHHVGHRKDVYELLPERLKTDETVPPTHCDAVSA